MAGIPAVKFGSNPSDAALSIAVLGTSQICLAGQAITHFQFERVRALLFYLAVELETIHSRATLSTLLWPDAPPKTALENLRQALASLRRVLKDQKRSVPFLQITAKTVCFNPASDYTLDYSRFIQHLRHSRYHPHRRLGACSSCIHHLRQAVALYQGDFLANVTINSELFEEWARDKREALHQRAMSALSDLIDYHLQRGEVGEAIHLGQRQLGLDPLCNRANHHLIQALAADQRRHAALAHYERYVTLLDRELSVAPPRETRELCEQLRSDGWQVGAVPAPPPYHLPCELTAFIGYEKEVTYLRERLANRHYRLLTITGIGGSGKTRTALRVAWDERFNFRDGVYFVDLTEVAPEQLRAAIAAVLPMQAQPGEELKRALPAWLKHKELLLVLDNFDHLVNQAPWLTHLLQQAPQLTILVTSREWLKVQGETVLVLRGLKCPPETEHDKLAQYPAVRLFLDHARRLQADVSLAKEEDRASIAALCRLVGGLPLALELAASWAPLFPPAELVSQITSGLAFLSSPLRTLPRWQRRMASAFLLSVQRLNPQEQQVYGRLSVFRHSFTADAASTIAQATPTLLMALQTKSLLHYVPSADPNQELDCLEPGLATRRYEIMPFFRFFAADMLQSQSRLAPWLLAVQHSRYYFALLRREVEALAAPSQAQQARQRLRAELKNIEQAWQWALAQQQYDAVARAQYPLVRYYLAEGDTQRAAQVLNEALACLVQAGRAPRGPRRP